MTLEELQAEMKAKGGFFGLTKEQQAEYKKLKEGSAPSKKTEPKKEPKDSEITLSKAELEKMVSGAVSDALDKERRVHQDISPDGKWQRVDVAKMPKKTCKFRYYQEDSDDEKGILIDLKFHKNVYDENTRQYDKPIYKFTVLYDDNSQKVFEEPLIKLINMIETETCAIIEENKEVMRKVIGRVVKPGKDKSGYIMSRGGGSDAPDSFERYAGAYADLEEVKEVRHYKIKRPSGQVFECHERQINL